jgi:hypothetical protein
VGVEYGKIEIKKQKEMIKDQKGFACSQMIGAAQLLRLALAP